MRRLLFLALLCAFVVSACGRGEPQELTAAGSTVDEKPTPTTFITDATTTTVIEPTTTSAPPPTTTAPPTTVPHFSVKSVEVNMQTCHNGYPPQGGAGSTYGCLGTYTIHLNPGIGGRLEWKAMWHYATYCHEPEWPGISWTYTGANDVADGATEVTGRLAVFGEFELRPKMVDGQLATDISTVELQITNGGAGSSGPTKFYGDATCENGEWKPTYGDPLPYP